MEWKSELTWMMANSGGKSWRAKFLKTAFVETIYECWRYTNEKTYGKNKTNTNIIKGL